VPSGRWGSRWPSLAGYVTVTGGHGRGDRRGVFASMIFERTRPVAQRLQARYPHPLIGGTGWDVTLEHVGFITQEHAYSVYPG